MKMLRSILTWLEDRTGLGKAVGPVLTHPIPQGTDWFYVFGSATLVSFVVQVVTGIALALVFAPSTDSAYESLQYISHQAPLGALVRGMHYWGASAMIFFMGVHVVRVFLTGSFKFPREMNWLTGVILFLVVIGLGFTGQLLRWDENAIYTIVVGAEQAGRTPFIGELVGRFLLGGEFVGAATLSRFFAFHVFFLPGIVFAVVGLHLYLVIRNGISEPAQPGRPVDKATYRTWYESLLKREGRPFWPDAMWRDALFGLVVVGGIVLLAWLVGAPELGLPPNPSNVHVLPRPDWYFMWYFAVLALIPHHLTPYMIVGGPALAFLVLGLMPFLFGSGERSPKRRPWAVASIIVIVIAIGVLWYEGIKAPWSPDFSAEPLTADIIGATSGPVAAGGHLFAEKGCIYCHRISGHGGRRGPDLTTIGNRLTVTDLKIRIANGGYNMPEFASILSAQEMDELVAFLRSRRTSGFTPEPPQYRTPTWP